MAKKIRVGLLFGGQSAEHEVSLLSAKNVIDAIDKNKYELTLIGIDKQGQWHVRNASNFLGSADDPKMIHLKNAQDQVALVTTSLVSLGTQTSHPIDVIFPILHGTHGEDGTVQGLLKLANVPFVGAGVLGSAIGMDKDVMKRLLRDAALPVGKFLVFHSAQIGQIDFHAVQEKLGLPFFIKPANQGSSVGVSKVSHESDFKHALERAFLYDHKVLIEEFIEGREIECSVLGNEDPIVSLPGEVIPQHDFYSYEAKYIDENGARFNIPATLDAETISRVQDLAIWAYKVLCCEGMARVDFFLKNNGEIYLNEINTIPGFTSISMYPVLWEVSGLSYTNLIDRLIQLAIERFQKDKKLKTSH